MPLAMALGGMASSTAGGVKSLRIGLVLKILKNHAKAVILPDRAVVSQAYYQGGRKRLTPPLAQAVLLVTLLYVALYLAGTVAGLAPRGPSAAALLARSLWGAAPAAADGGSVPFHVDEVTVADLLAAPEAYMEMPVVVRG